MQIPLKNINSKRLKIKKDEFVKKLTEFRLI
jgi:hypothetical protein